MTGLSSNVECTLLHTCTVVVVTFASAGFMMRIKIGGIKKLVKEATWEKLVKEATLVISASNNMLCDHNLLRSIIKRLTMKEIF